MLRQSAGRDVQLNILLKIHLDSGVSNRTLVAHLATEELARPGFSWSGC